MYCVILRCINKLRTAKLVTAIVTCGLLLRSLRFTKTLPHATATDKSPKRLRIIVSHQGCIPIYRKSFYDRLNAIGHYDYVIVHGLPPRGTDIVVAPAPYDFPNITVHNREVRIAGRSCIWQTAVVGRAIKGDFDAAVIGDDIKFISSSIIMLALLARRRPVLLWGFGFHPYDKRPTSLRARLIPRLVERLKKLRYRLASGYLAYTDGGANALRTLRRPPKHIAVLKNTIDTEAESRLCAAVASEPLGHMCHELGVRLNSTKLLYFGRLVPMKRVDLLIEYARRAVHTGRNLDIIVFGEGGDKARLSFLASGLENMAFHVHDDLKLSRALRVSAAIVIPGAVGLAITHGFVHGVPTVTRSGQLHGPEIAYLQNGVNGLILPEAPECFFGGLDEFVRDLNLQHLLAEGAKQSARAINMDCMVAAFHGLVSECLGFSASAL